VHVGAHPLSTDPSDEVIVARGLTKRFGPGQGLDDLSLSVRRGQVLALLGPNGAGKTTTVRLLNGIMCPDQGSCSVVGLDPVTDGEAVRRRTGVLTEHTGLDDRLSAVENLVVAARIRGWSAPEARTASLELLERFAMDSLADRSVRGMSTGQRKRIALARALLHRPEVLFLDEPTSGLDPEATRDVLDLIAALAAEGRTIVLCTHFLGEAERLATNVAVLIGGRLRAFGTTAELAAQRWQTVEVTVMTPAHDLEVSERAAGEVQGVVRVARGIDRLTVWVSTATVVPRLVRSLVDAGVSIEAVTPRDRTLEDVYFAVLQESGGNTVPLAGPPPAMVGAR
jgi:ABC-2 type transport system ATP-binding protein